MNYKLVFSIEIFAFLLISFMAVAIEGKAGGLFGRNVAYGVSADAWLLLAIALFISIPITIKGFDSKLIGTLLVGAFVGGILEDFFWFVINPYFGLNRFNPEYATWLSWSDLGFKIPTFYLVYSVLTAVAWFLFIKNSSKVNHWYKLTFKKNH